MNLIAKIVEFFEKYRQPRFRDKRGAFDASAIMANARDLYWKSTGEKETNPTDYTGNMRMRIGKWIENGLNQEILQNLHWFGVHAYGGEQTPIGGSDPDINGYLDAILVQRVGDKFGKPVVMELKTKQGYGADLLCQSYDPGPSYLAQLGYYLKDLHEKGFTNEGMFIFILLSDSRYGEMVQIDCRYDEMTDEVIAYKARHVFGDERDIDFRLKLTPALQRLQLIKQQIESGELPSAEHFYKMPLTPNTLAGVSDAQLRKAIAGEKILGDWEIAYSRFKDKHIEMEGSAKEYTDEELAVLRSEYARRHPKSKKFA